MWSPLRFFKDGKKYEKLVQEGTFQGLFYMEGEGGDGKLHGVLSFCMATHTAVLAETKVNDRR